MESWIYLLVLGFVPCVVSDGVSLLDPCGVRDINCLSHSTEQFLEKTCNGIPQYDIRPIDPMIIKGPLVDSVDENIDLVFRFTNLNVTGLRTQKISDFQMDLEAKSVVLKTKAVLQIVGDITIEIGNSKTLFGVYHSSGTVLGAASYNYELQTDDKGVEHFIVGPEKLTCEAIEEPTVSLNQELQEVLSKDADAKSLEPTYKSNKAIYRKQTICKIAEVAYKDVVHNIRAAAKILPKSAFFLDV